MTAYQQFAERIRQTEVMKDLIASLDSEPARLLHLIRLRYDETGRPVPDHYLQLTGYFGETMLRVLASAGLIQRVEGERFALSAYAPTPEGRRMDDAMISEK